MYKCPCCVNNFVAINSLIAHVKLIHNASTSSFICKEDNCFRNFINIHSFKRHLMLKHLNLDENVYISQKVCDDNILYQTNSDCKFQKYVNSEDLITVNVCDQLINKSVTLKHFDDIVTQNAASFVLKLYSDASMSRSQAHKIIDYVNEFYKLTIGIIQLKYENQITTHNVSFDIKHMCIILQNAFAEFKTDYQTLQYFIRRGYLIMPQCIDIAAVLRSKRLKIFRNIDVATRSFQIIPIRSLLKKFLQLPNVFHTIIEHLSKQQHIDDRITSFIQGETWKHVKEKFAKKLVLPLLLYFDDFEINNPLGSHRGVHKIGATYCTIPAIPYEYSSMLENIFVFQMHDTMDHLQFGNKVIFSNIVSQINDLETNGLIINVNNKQETIYFALIGIIGDNLGLHTIFGFSKSFNSQYSCRVCLADKTTLQTQILEQAEILRTKFNYATDCTTKMHGIQEECFFNTISSFHVIENICFDVMHDIFEGICRYEIAKILNNVINIKKLFSLDTLNYRLRYFDYPIGNNENIPLSIINSSLRNECLLISASEMCTLVKFLGLLIGDLIPHTTEVWQLYMNLREIICIIMAPMFTKESCKLLEVLISEHHILYMDLFKESLKPKHHYLIHYPQIMKKMGPLKHVSCIRFEAKHKEIKQNAKVITSRRNPSYTLALKHQLGLAHRFLTNKGFENRFSTGVVLKDIVTELHDYNMFKKVLPEDIDKTYFSVSWININGTVYKPGMIIELNSEDMIRSFGYIQHIVTNINHNVYYIYRKVETLVFSQHVHAFQVAQTNIWGCIAHVKLSSFVPNSIHTMTDGKFYVPCT